MLQTIEAIIEPSGEVRLLETVHIQTPKRALLTILESVNSERGSAAAILQRLRENPLPSACRRSAEEIDEQIEQERSAYKSA